MNGDRRSRILSSLVRGGGAGGAAVAALSTAVVVGLVVLVVSRSSGWPEVKAQFFSWDELTASMPGIAEAFLVNVRYFLIAEAIVLVAGLVVAVLRGLTGPVFFPLRLFAILYTDFFRGVPLILLIYLLGFGAPALQISGLPTSPGFWGVTALCLVYTAYVAEVYRAGIESVHPSQDAAARSLGLSRAQSMRFVVLPQAVRRVMPPLLNDFIGLQKDTALIAVLGVVEALRQAQIDSAATFNYTPYVAAAILFLAVTIPLTRLTDWLIARDRRRRQAAGAAA